MADWERGVVETGYGELVSGMMMMTLHGNVHVGLGRCWVH